MSDIHVPYEKLLQLKDKIGIEEEDINVLSPFAGIFTGRKEEFADYFYSVFYEIPEARVILENESTPGLLKKVWAEWFGQLFSSRLDRRFLTYLWNIGVRHVEVNLDHRFTNLGFSVIRQFCHRIILDDIKTDREGMLVFVFDKLLDLCLLIETDAFIEKTTRCDLQVFHGVEDRIRNPALVIGANIKRLQRQVEEGSKEYKVYETVIGENMRLERMVSDVKDYMETFSEEVSFGTVSLQDVVDGALDTLRKEPDFAGAKVETNLAGDCSHVTGDRGELERLFLALIRNGLEAADGTEPLVRVTSQREKMSPYSVEIEVFNQGVPPRQEDIENLFTPFYSTKIAGSGFGLPMAKLIVRKHYGKIRMEPAGTGTRVIVSLPGVCALPD